MKKQNGQILIFALVFMLVITIIVVALVGYAGVQIKSHRQAVKRIVGLDIGEAALELAIWKLNNQVGYTGEVGTSYGDGEYDVTITDISGNQKLISADVYVPNSINPVAKRTVQITASVSTDNISFNYGAQVGEGGLVMGNNSGVNGNVYSNGNISGSNGAFVTGTAIAANSAALVADQVNDTPSTPASLINFRNASASADAAQSFQINTTGPVNKVDLYIRKVGNPSNFTAIRITNDNSGNPGSTTIASGPLNASLITTNYGWVTMNFSTNPNLTAGTTYWLVLDASGTSATNYYQWAANNTYASGLAKTGAYSGGPWTNANLDGYFKLYLGGLTGTIDNVDISGDARAHTVDNSTITGNNYCQVGSGNNKSCNTSQADPTPLALPISAGNITDWEADAEAGGVTNGDYTLTNGATGSLGPQKINGDLTLSNNAVLTLTGTVWVTGTISVSNNSIIRLSAAYGGLSGVLIAGVNGSSTAGLIDLSNNGFLEGSGAAGSYMLGLSQMNSPTNIAINVANNVGTAILYAGTGVIQVSNNGAAKEITGYKITMSNNATITYESGLANAQFSAGPGGSWELLDGSWQLIQ